MLNVKRNQKIPGNAEDFVVVAFVLLLLESVDLRPPLASALRLSIDVLCALVVGERVVPSLAGYVDLCALAVRLHGRVRIDRLHQGDK